MKEFSFRTFLENSPDFHRTDQLFHQRNFQAPAFEREYISLRNDEGRLIDQSGLLTGHPSIQPDHSAEWEIRTRSAKKLIRYLRKQSPGNVLEVGCGDGWLIRMIHSALHVDCCGVDINKTEIQAASRVAPESNGLTYLVADITSGIFPVHSVDIVVLPAVIQYFRDINSLIDSLRRLLSARGEIHILDSPIYQGHEIPHAKNRSAQHFRKINHPGMTEFYFHHSWKSFVDYSATMLYDPGRWTNRLLRRITHDSPFPWIRIINSP